MTALRAVFVAIVAAGQCAAVLMTGDIIAISLPGGTGQRAAAFRRKLAGRRHYRTPL